MTSTSMTIGVLVMVLGIPIIGTSYIREEHLENCVQNNNHLLCKNEFPTKAYTNIDVLKITDSRIDNLDLKNWHRSFQNLSSLTVIGNNRTKLRRIAFPREKLGIKILKLNNLQITSVFLENITNHFIGLEVLDISNNYIADFPKFNYSSLKEVYLKGNKWNCSKSLEWILDLDLSVFRDLPELKCFRMPHNNKPLLAIAQFRKITAETCTPNCSCHLEKCVTYMNTDVLEPIIEVNCSFRGFRTLPDTFPVKTKTIRLEGNEISDLSALRTNLRYRNVLDIYLDNNKLTNIHVLEGSHWLTNFRVFSLRNNQIEELPTYALDDAFKRNPNMPDAVRLNLGGNPWRCNCVFMPRFKEMLQKYAPQIKDIRDIRCAEDSENSLVPIMDLSRSSVCHSPTEYTVQEALDLLNVVLGLLIILILGKLAYDYYNFKKTGKLPWIVTKMP
ncbi:protein singed wings 2 [Sitophilus oryzae]|uniref:Protein singed wings 2 n=1 Tax=Sitophilus oryzae TaxID=7048 RepID=A0A6J2XL11_SITOR|nr:protein singed wings 2 [Sitophilus oryzae]